MHDLVKNVRFEEFDVYIGRGQFGGAQSAWGNPFTHKNGTQARYVVGSRDEAVEAYRKHLWDRIRSEGEPLLRALAELHGKRLGCWCAPQRCHGEVLVAASAWALDELARRAEHAPAVSERFCAECGGATRTNVRGHWLCREHALGVCAWA